jgi:hypothetical protein
MAVALGLRVAVDGSVSGLEEAAVSVLARLDQLLPHHLAARVRAIHETTTLLERPTTELVRSDVPLTIGGDVSGCHRDCGDRWVFRGGRGRQHLDGTDGPLPRRPALGLLGA